MEQENYIHDREKVAEKQEKILALSQREFGYQYWYAFQEEAAQDFQAYVQQQPEKIRTMLVSYAGACQMTIQRLLITACEYMDFMDPRLRE